MTVVLERFKNIGIDTPGVVALLGMYDIHTYIQCPTKGVNCIPTLFGGTINLKLLILLMFLLFYVVNLTVVLLK